MFWGNMGILEEDKSWYETIVVCRINYVEINSVYKIRRMAIWITKSFKIMAEAGIDRMSVNQILGLTEKLGNDYDEQYP